LSETGTFHKELHRDRCLSRPGIAFDEIKVIASQASSENVVKTGDAGGEQFYGRSPGAVDAGTIARFRGSYVLCKVRIHDVPQLRVLRMRPGLIKVSLCFLSSMRRTGNSIEGVRARLLRDKSAGRSG
jgi:hypothetical protein